MYRVLLAVLLLLLSSGCSTFQSGGAPAPSADLTTDLAAIEKQMGTAASIEQFYAAPSVDARNRFIAARLVSINLRYLQFLRGVTMERQALDTATDILVMSLGIAGASFNPAGTKTILAAASSGISGSKTAIDKYYYFEKSLPALIAAMNAKRAEMLIPILEGRSKSLEEYSFEQAVTDLHQYYYAGTYSGAFEAIQADAGERSAQAADVIATLSVIPQDLIQKKTNMISAINALTADDLPQAQAAVAKAWPSESRPETIADAKVQLRRAVRNTHTDQEAILRIASILKEANILK